MKEKKKFYQPKAVFQPFRILLESMPGKELFTSLENTEIKEDEQKLKEIPVLAFVGASGTGKSTRALELAKKYHVDFLIDDGLLIRGGRILAGSSAKKAHTKIDSVRQAVFAEEERALIMKRALSFYSPDALMILGTSDKMLQKITQNLGLSLPLKTVYIEEITTFEERQEAKYVRYVEGQHTIPVPTMEVKHEFSGYFLNPFSEIKKRRKFSPSPFLHSDNETEKTVVRPNYSSLGKYSISDEALRSLSQILLKQMEGVAELLNFSLEKDKRGIRLYLELSLYYGYQAQILMKKIQEYFGKNIEMYTSINVLAVHVRASRLLLKEKGANLLKNEVE